MPSRQPRQPSMGFSSWRALMRSMTKSKGTPSFSANWRRTTSSWGKNSCRGGSSRRMVTGRPSIALNSPTKSFFWNGKSFLRADRRCTSSAARIIWRMMSMRSPSKNICSVRHRPMPSAPKATACFAIAGVSALVRTLRVRCLSAQLITVWKSS